MKQRTLSNIIALMLCLALCLTMGGTCLAYSGVSSWAEEEVAEADELGFLPDSLSDSVLSGRMTRLEMCQLAVNAFEVSTSTPLFPAATDHFTDTKDADVCIAYELGIVSGYPDGTFRPEKDITRQEFSKIMANLLDALGWSYSSQLLSQFSDEAQLASWAQEAAVTVLQLGIVNGNSNGTLTPGATTSVEQALVMFLRAYDYLITNQYGTDAGIAPPADPIEYVPTYTGCSSWAQGDVQRMDLMGLIPASLSTAVMTQPITRGQMCEIAVLTYERLSGESVEAQDTHFSDTSLSAINCAYELGIIDGFPDRTFRPDNNLTRQQFFQITYKLLQAAGWQAETDAQLLSAAFTDAGQIADWAQSPIATLYRLGVMQGNSNGTVTPLSSTTREQAIVLFMRTYVCIRDWYARHPLEEIEGPLTELSRIQQVVNYALSFEGAPYVWASTDPTIGFDCSGFVYHVYSHFGYNIHRTTSVMMTDGIGVTRAQLQPGDILFFASNGSSSPNHVGLYIGDSKMIHAANTRRGVVIDHIDYDQNKYICAIRRIIY